MNGWPDIVACVIAIPFLAAWVIDLVTTKPRRRK